MSSGEVERCEKTVSAGRDLEIDPATTTAVAIEKRKIERDVEAVNVDFEGMQLRAMTPVETLDQDVWRVDMTRGERIEVLRLLDEKSAFH